MQRIRDYYYLTKPGIVWSNVLMALSGFLLASQWHVELRLLVGLVGGVIGIIAAACVFNNYLDQGIDRRMKRTNKRALVAGTISGRQALIFGSILAVIGFGLVALTNWLTFGLGIIAIIMYVGVYGYFKRNSVYGTLVGSISGALPPAAGYTAVTGSFDAAAWVLFIILAAWQMPHFYAIAMFRRSDYAAAKLPVLPVVHGMAATRRQIMGYIILLAVVAPLLTVFGYTGVVYLVIVLLTTLGWLAVGMVSWRLEPEKWARKMFGYSLLVLLVMEFAIATGSVLV